MLVKRQLNLSFQTWHGVTDFPERRRRKGVVPYLLPPLQLTKDALKALVHVVELGRSKRDCWVSLQAFTFLILLLMETAFIARADYKNQIQKWLIGHERLFLNVCETSRCRCACAHVWSEDLDPARFLLSPGVFEAEGHALLVCVPALHLPPLESYHLVLSRTRKNTQLELNLRLSWAERVQA